VQVQVQVQVAPARALRAQAVQVHPLQAQVVRLVRPELLQQVRAALSLQLAAAEWVDAPVAVTQVAVAVVQVAAAAVVPLVATTVPTWTAQ
jgi:hypothetical protein